MEYLLGIDLGTSYFKAGLFDFDFNVIGLGRVAVEKNINDNRIELPTERFWSLLKDVLNQACKQANTETKNIKAVSYSSQANTFLLLDKKNKPLTPLILWTDERSEKVTEELLELGNRNDFIQITGQGQSYTINHMASKLCWLRENEPQIFSKTNRIMTISDYLIQSLTGRYISDAGTTALTAMIDVQKMKWWPDALETVSLKQCQMCKLVRPGTTIGKINIMGHELLGLPQNAVLVAGSLDHHAAAVGSEIGTIADMSESTGTVLACVNIANNYSPKANVCIGPDIKESQYWQLAWDTNGAIGLEWYQQNYAKQLTIEQLIDMAKDIPAGCEGLTAKPMCWTDDGLKGFKGINDKLNHGHFIKAIMESTAYTLKDITERLSGSKTPRVIIATGGGAKSNLWLKIKSEIAGTKVIASDCPEPACRGAAVLASTAMN